MISFVEARVAVQESARPLGVARVALRDALGMFLAEDIHSPHDVPFFDNSAVDGYAVRVADLGPGPVALPVEAEIRAGDEPLSISTGVAAVRVFTGSPMPRGCDSIVMQEEVEREGETVRLAKPVATGKHVRRRGEEIRTGEKIAARGACLTPAAAALLASLGFVDAPVYERPRVAVVGTGSELVPPGSPLREGQIYESNSLAIEGALRCMGLQARSVESVPDVAALVEKALRSALEAADVVITCGGVSVGDHDLILPTLDTLGCEKVFWKVAMKPGKPFLFAKGPSGQLVFGLPGNPVSALVTFYALVRPAMMRMIGAPDEPSFRATLGRRIGKQSGRHELIRGRLTAEGVTLVATPLDRQGSHMMTGLSDAECLIHAPADVECIDRGEVVEVTPLKWGLM